MSTATAAAGILLATALASAAAAQEKSVMAQLTGAWTLASVYVGEGDKKAEPYGPSPKGALLLAPNGSFALTIVRAGLGKFASNNREQGTVEENTAVVKGSLAYFGSYTVTEAEHVIEVKIDGSTFPNFDGTSQKRLFKLSGDELTLTNAAPSGGGGTAVQVWKRAK